MPTTSRRASHFNAIEINNNNIANVQNQQQNANNLNSGNSTSSVGVEAAGTAVAAPLMSPKPPIVAAAKAAIANKKSVGVSGGEQKAAASVTRSISKPAKKALSKRAATAASSNKQRRQSQIANIRLIKLVRRRPWLYDSSHMNYAKKHVVENTWSRIGRMCNESGVICKERWRNIRAAFARSINLYKTESGPNRLKPYYLHQELKFLISPMTKRRKPQIKLDNPLAHEDASSDEQNHYDNGDILMDDEDEDENENEDDYGDNDADIEVESNDNDNGNGNGHGHGHGNADSNDDAQNQGQEAVSSNRPPVAVRNPGNKMINNSMHNEQVAGNNATNSIVDVNGFITADAAAVDAATEDSMNFSFSDNTSERNRLYDCDNLSPKNLNRKKPRLEDLPEDPDLLFVKSLYYDMGNLEAAQKVRFKRQVYEALEKVSTQSTTDHGVSTSATLRQSSALPTVAPLSTMQKQSLRLLCDLNETQLQNLNQYVKYVLTSTSTSASNSTSTSVPMPISKLPDCQMGNSTRQSTYKGNRDNSQPVHNVPARPMANETQVSGIVTRMAPNSSRMPPTVMPMPENLPNGISNHACTVKEESFDYLAMCSPSF